MHHGILDWIWEQKKDVSKKTDEIQMKSVVSVSSSVPTLI